MKTRIYIVHKTLPLVNMPVLVEAQSVAQATAYVAASLFTVRPATGLEIAAAMRDGHDVHNSPGAVHRLPASKIVEASGNG